MRLYEPEKLTENSERRVARLRAHSTARRRWALQWILVFLAVLSAWFVLFSTGSFAGDQGEEAARSVVAEALTEDEVGGVAEGLLRESLVLEEEQEEAPGFDAEALEDEIEEIVGEYEGVYGVSVLEPDSGTRVSLRGDEEFVAASIGKLPPFAALYAAAARGEVDLEEEISIREEDVQSYGSGSLHGFPVGHSLSLRDVANRLINHSDNTAWAMFDRRLGKAEIGAELESMGIEDSSYYGHASGYYTTPDDVLLLLERISDPRFTDEELSAEMLEAMTETSVEDRIPERLPEDVRVAHKTGSYEGNFGDAGVVFYKDSQGEERRYYLAVLSEGTGEYEARDVIQKVSLAVYEAISGTTVDPEWSRGSVREEEKSAPDTSPMPQPALAEDTGRPTENVQPAKPPSVEKPSRPPEGRYNFVPVTRSAPQASKPAPPPYPTTYEPAYYREEPGYWEDAYWEEW
ncbi:MAG: class A beta-lactamase-related serine hydrolase [Actinomycetota bacterium]|nr:class A beta-lactamase-related serine hydrolase [Actinomycetota bacterium]